MFPDVPLWVYANVGFLLVYLVVHAFVYYRYRIDRTSATATAGRADGTPNAGRSLKADGGSTIGRDSGPGDGVAVDADGTVRCPNCETVNERSFRFCRSCAGDMVV